MSTATVLTPAGGVVCTVLHRCWAGVWNPQASGETRLASLELNCAAWRHSAEPGALLKPFLAEQYQQSRLPHITL